MNETCEERETREAKMEEAFLATMRKVPEYMPAWTWTNLDRDGEPERGHGYLIGVDGAKISSRLDTWHNRITLYGCYPSGCGSTYGIKAIEITVSPLKEPCKIAKDIQGRLLPIYWAELSKAKEQIRQHNEYEANKKTTIQKIADYLGVEIHENGSVYTREALKEVYSIEPYGKDTVKFTVECSADQAIKVFEALKS